MIRIQRVTTRQTSMTVMAITTPSEMATRTKARNMPIASARPEASALSLKDSSFSIWKARMKLPPAAEAKPLTKVSMTTWPMSMKMPQMVFEKLMAIAVISSFGRCFE